MDVILCQKIWANFKSHFSIYLTRYSGSTPPKVIIITIRTIWFLKLYIKNINKKVYPLELTIIKNIRELPNKVHIFALVY